MTFAAKAVTAAARMRVLFDNGYFKSALGEMSCGDQSANACADNNYRFLFHNFLNG
jgi:hypothetical protein